jgi:hypothetical protein
MRHLFKLQRPKEADLREWCVVVHSLYSSEVSKVEIYCSLYNFINKRHCFVDDDVCKPLACDKSNYSRFRVIWYSSDIRLLRSAYSYYIEMTDHLLSWQLLVVVDVGQNAFPFPWKLCLLLSPPTRKVAKEVMIIIIPRSSHQNCGRPYRLSHIKQRAVALLYGITSNWLHVRLSAAWDLLLTSS